MRLIITKQWKVFTVCTEQLRSPYIEHAASGLPNLTRLEGGVRFMQEVPGSVGPNAPVPKPSWRCCSQLCHLGGGPYWDCFSLLRSYQAWSNQLTCDKDPDIRQSSRPKTTGTKPPKGLIRRDEGDFLTLQEGPRKGFSPVLPRALAGAYWPCHAHCESHVF